MIDGATNRPAAQFFAGETTAACLDLIERGARRPGLPQSR